MHRPLIMLTSGESARNRRGALAPAAQWDLAKTADNGVATRLALQERRWSKTSNGDVKEEHGLTPKQVEAFHEVFSLFDVNGGGTIDAGELDAALKSVDIQLTRYEIEEVLQVIDEDGNGEIDFDEFLSLMTSTEKYLATLRGTGEDEKQESVFFAALTKFMKKSALSSLSEIERYYNNKVRKAPHVVGHYAAGARLIGLTEREMAKRLATLSVGSKTVDSPYAQPIVGIFVGGDRPQCGRQRTGKIKLKINKYLREDSIVKMDGSKDEAISSLPKLGSGEVTTKETENNVLSAGSERTPSPRAKSACKPKAISFLITDIPLPAVNLGESISKEPSSLTIEDLPKIRSKVNTAYTEYKRKLSSKKEDINHLHLEHMDVGAIPSKMLKNHFLRIAGAYGFSSTDSSRNSNLHPWNVLGGGKTALDINGLYA